MPRPSAGSRTTPLQAAAGSIQHLMRADPVLGALVEAHGPLGDEPRRRGRPAGAYGALVRSIVGQQLSTKAARAIYARLVERFGGRAPTPAQILAAAPEEIRGAGLSGPKVTYLRDLAERIEAGELEAERLVELADADVAAQLTAVKGLGQWTADMFLIFHLGRPDVLPVGDLGTRSAVRRVYALEELPDAEELTRIAEPWRPHRSLAALYLWRSLDAVPVA